MLFQYFLIRKLCVRIRFLRDSRIMTTSSLSLQDGRTALMLASGSGHREIAQLLVDRGADVNTQEKVGNCTFLICLLLETFVPVLDF